MRPTLIPDRFDPAGHTVRTRRATGLDSRLPACVDGHARADRTSGRGSLDNRAATQVGVLEGWGSVVLVERADVGARRNDPVDLVEEVVGEHDVRAGQEIVEVLHRAGAQERAGDPGVGDGERHGEVGHG